MKRNFKRCSSLLLAFLLCFMMLDLSVLAVSPETTSTVSVGQVKGAAGDEVIVNVSLEQNPGINYLKLNIEYDKTVLTLTDVENTALISGYFVQSENIENTPFTLLWASASDATDDGVIAKLKFKIADGAAVGVSDVDISVAECYNDADSAVTLSAISGSVAVVESAVEIVSHTSNPGVSETVAVRISGNLGFNYIKYSMKYDTDALYISEVQCDTADFEGSYVVGPDKSALVFANASNVTGDGVLAYVTFTYKEGAAGGEYPVSLKIVECYNDADEAVTFAVGSDYVISVAEKKSEIAIKGTSVKAGQKATVKLDIANNPGFNYIKIELGYDDDLLTLDSVELDSNFEGYFVTSESADVLPYVLLFAKADNVTASGTFATLVFNTSSDISESESASVDFKVVECYNDADENVEFDEVKCGSIEISPKAPVEEPDPPAIEKVVVGVGDGSVEQSSDVKIAVNVTENSGFNYMKLKFTYDTTRLTLKSVDEGEVFDGYFVTGTDGSIWVFANDSDITATGVLGYLTFTAAADAATDTAATIGVTVEECYNDADEAVDVEATSGTVTITEYVEPDPPAIEKVVVGVGSGSVEQSSDVKIAVNVTENSGFNYMKLKFTYDATRLTLKSVDKGEVFDGYFVTGTDGSIWVFANDSDITATGVLGYLTFTAAADAATDTAATIGVTVEECYNDADEAVDVEATSGTVTITEYVDPNPPAPPVTPSVTIGSADVKGGESITVDITADDVSGINFLKLSVLFDDEIVSIEKIESLISDVTFTESENLAVSPAVLVWANAGNFEADGVIAKITFKVSESAETCELPLTLTVDQAFDEDDNAIVFDVFSGALNIEKKEDPTPEVVYGDADGDGVIDLKDATLILQYLAEWDDIEMIDANADANGDGVIDLKDVTLILQYLAEWDDVVFGPSAD